VPRGGVFAELTANVLRDPRIGPYVSRLYIEGWFPEWTITDQESDPPVHKEYPKDTMHVVGEAGMLIQSLLELGTKTWQDSFKEGDEDAVIALLLLYLINLETLSLEAVYNCKYLHSALEHAHG